MREVMHLFFFNDTATTEIYTLSLHDALPISRSSNGSLARAEYSMDDGLVGRFAMQGIEDRPGSCEIGRASCRERVYISVVAVSLKTHKATSSTLYFDSLTVNTGNGSFLHIIQ